MNILLTEAQYNYLLETEVEQNFKPARYFDRIHGTNTAQSYDFGDNLSSEDVWKIAKNCFGGDDCDEIKKLANRLNSDMIPIKNVEKLPLETKIDILMGMASELNVYDIYHFSVRGIKHFNNLEVNNFLDTLPQDIYDGINWVMSPETLKEVKPKLMQYSNEF